MGNPATEFVQASRELSPVHAYIADHGEAVNSGEIIRETIAGRSVAVSADLTDDERELVADAIRATEPRAKACFANALRMWDFDDRFKYSEGFAAASDLEIHDVEHAWSLLDGSKFVDVTQPSTTTTGSSSQTMRRCNGTTIPVRIVAATESSVTTSTTSNSSENEVTSTGRLISTKTVYWMELKN
jgi:hypothetical protein